MINKIAPSIEAALAGVKDGSTVMIGGFGTAGIPNELIDGLIAQGAKDLVIVNNNAGNADTGLAALLKAGRVRKIICSFPRQADSHVFDELYRSGKLELELVPQGNLAGWSWCRRATWPSAYALRVPVWVRFSRQRVTAPSWPRARKRVRSMASTTCWKCRFMAM